MSLNRHLTDTTDEYNDPRMASD